jgi:hypothetical protein
MAGQPALVSFPRRFPLKLQQRERDLIFAPASRVCGNPIAAVKRH